MVCFLVKGQGIPYRVVGRSKSTSGSQEYSTTNLWAVGYYTNNNGISQTLIEHWNGRSWKVVASPNIGPYGNELYGVIPVSPTDIWTVGSSMNNGKSQTLTEEYS